MASVEVPGATLYYEVTGEGPPIVFAHGAGGNCLSWWQQVPEFTRDHRAVRFDHRSFGRSPCDEGAFHPRALADDLRAILDAADIERTSLVCQSLGGWAGLRFALENPERVCCLVLCGTPGGIAHPSVLEAAAGVADRIAREGVRGSAALAPGFEIEQPGLAFLYDQISGLNVGFDMQALGKLFDPEVAIAPERMRDFAVPTLMIAGGRDLLFPIDVLRAIAGLIPGVLLREFATCGHSVYFEAADEFNAVVRTFIEDHEQRA
ncbi:MAG: alpha/beta fold hydrolase [bacterium]|nr:alpha/beta fold hydrolase [bacterium]